MKYKTFFSTTQIQCLLLMVVAILAYFETDINTFKGFSYVFGILAILTFIGETQRKRFIANPYQKNDYKFNNERGIAKYFLDKGIIFKYKPEITVNKTLGIFSVPFWNIKLKPTFYLPEFEIYVEYWEEMNDEKMKIYRSNDISVLSLYPEDLQDNNLDWHFTKRLLEMIKEEKGLARR